MSTTNILLCVILYFIIFNAMPKKQSTYVPRNKREPAYKIGRRLLGGAQSKKFAKHFKKG